MLVEIVSLSCYLFNLCNISQAKVRGFRTTISRNSECPPRRPVRLKASTKIQGIESPEDNDPSRACVWQIEAEDDSYVISYRLVNLNIGCTTNCVGGFVETRDGDEDDHVIRRTCGPLWNRGTFTTSGRRLTITFRPEDKKPGRKFLIEYWMASSHVSCGVKQEIYSEVEYGPENVVLFGLFSVIVISALILTLVSMIRHRRHLVGLYESVAEWHRQLRYQRRGFTLTFKGN